MDSTHINDMAKQLFEGLPAAARALRHDIEGNFRAVLQARLGRLDLTTRSEFEVQAKVLERTRARVEALETELAELERRLQQVESRQAT